MSVCKFVSAALLACALPIVGCADVPEDDGAAHADVDVIDKRSQALTADGSSILSVNGSYTGCKNRTGSWSLAVASGATLDNAALSVLLNDTSCALAVTSMVTQISQGVTETLTPSSPVSLTTSYGTAQPFGSPVKYYANAMISARYSGNFTLTVLFSDDPRIASGTFSSASYSTVSSTAATQGVAAPSYTVDLTGIAIATDYGKVVQSVSGNVALSGSGADYYSIVAGTVADDYDSVNAAFSGSTAMATSIAALNNFVAVGNTLPVTKSLILQKVTSGVKSYQKITVTFSAPP
jgi:hypothetical protein